MPHSHVSKGHHHLSCPECLPGIHMSQSRSYQRENPVAIKIMLSISSLEGIPYLVWSTTTRTVCLTYLPQSKSSRVDLCCWSLRNTPVSRAGRWDVHYLHAEVTSLSPVNGITTPRPPYQALLRGPSSRVLMSHQGCLQKVLAPRCEVGHHPAQSTTGTSRPNRRELIPDVL